MISNDSHRIIEHLETHGPMVGKRLSESLPEIDDISLWRACYLSANIRVKNCARYYLRYDILRTNQLRLSPSILRDFLTFSVVHLANQFVEGVEANTILANVARTISLKKLNWAREALMRLDEDLQKVLNTHCVVFLSGDISYYLAHETKRTHSQLGVEVNGSDIDLIVITNLEAPPEEIAKIESQLLITKKIYLTSPEIGEELDFIVKPISKMLEQLAYRDIDQKIASKILYESYFLMGRVDVYQALMKHLQLSGTWDRIEKDFATAMMQRKNTISKILALEPSASIEDPEVASLFFASKERLEFK